MSKKVATQPLSDNTRKLIIIIAIVLVAVIVLSIALALILKPEEKNPAGNNSGSTSSSTLPVKNGDFAYTSSDDTGYPRTAQDWDKYTYKAAESNGTHGFQSITTTEKTVMGVIDLDDWAEVSADLTAQSVNITNPGTHSSLEAEDHNVYMIYNKVSTTASILSSSTSVASGASVKITVWINASQLAQGSKAVIMIQKSSTSAKSDDWYAYNFQIVENDPADTADENGWQKHEFYIFNRETSSKNIKVSVGLGNVYQEGATSEEGIGAQGALFVDDITYETVTANDYRDQVDNNSDKEIEDVYKPFQIIENEDITDKSKYWELEADNGTTSIEETYTYSAEYAEEAGYSPFTDRDDFGTEDNRTGFKIFKVTQRGGKVVTALRLAGNGLELRTTPIGKDFYHISFWVRVEQFGGHDATEANVYVQKRTSTTGEWKDVDRGSFTSIATSQDIENDNNCGWVKYDIYLKPSTTATVEAPDYISILFVLGNRDNYTDKDIAEGKAPQGSLYVTSPASEQISNKDYSNASLGPNGIKLDLTGSSASPTVPNGSFSSVNNLGNEPTSWTPVFAGDNAIYKDGGDNVLGDELRNKSKTVGSGVVKGSGMDDAQKNVLSVSTNGTSFGYISSDVSLSSHTVYVFSVLVKLENATKPYIYLVDNSKDRADAIIARAENAYSDETQKKLDEAFVELAARDGWARYYLVYVTGDESATVRIALFNGAIDADETAAAATSGTILYDNVKMKSIGSYSLIEDEDNEDATEYLVEFKANNVDVYQDAIDALTNEDHDAINAESELIAALGAGAFAQPDSDEWNEMKKVPEKTEDEDNGGQDTTTKVPTEIDWGLLFSVISSVLLVAALLIVFVIKLFQRKRNRVA